ncbi:50S ribosomal subunit protein L4 [Wigglesworthia glossinidia endosymbiont of Glossina morsitans morsitans (Yale colony)]|uniref:Large ribosomal subunit protein uL4 n=1 Tax=Wigglesworthia glossinidia endosymbiont of Glossina morsitans morsitans (Yale colony) TaxID=1142511 RepID=H6Q4J2_WIGGL|nr:50S ribosomal protein L4 [Wigglesworthia glossinidia]AFA41052.1 50S ribosomal subunit protein L4 [Wigglesworthia glossinidia endosymbiont of Glossina morsitans morsitans (Yale colony)]
MEIICVDTKEKINLSEKIFGLKFNEPLIHQVINSSQNTQRQGTSVQKSRSDITGSGKKPWRQKGTGRARAGSTKSPIWRSGGVTFAKKTRSYKQKINKKMYQSALKSILSELLRQNRLILVKNFFVESEKTKNLSKKLQYMGLKNVLIISDKIDKNLILASRNLHKINVSDPIKLNLINLITHKKVLITEDAVKKFEAMLT